MFELFALLILLAVTVVVLPEITDGVNLLMKREEAGVVNTGREMGTTRSNFINPQAFYWNHFVIPTSIISCFSWIG